jgi:hypothetical protein
VLEGVVVAGRLVVELVVLVMLMAVAVVFMVVLVCPSHIIVLLFVKVVRSSSWTHTLGLNLETSAT